MNLPGPTNPAARSDTDRLADALIDPDHRRAQAAAREVIQRSDVDLATILDRLGECFDQPEAQLQRRAAQALALLGERAAPLVKVLLVAVRSSHWTVREAVLLALGSVAGTDATVQSALIHAALHDRVALVRTAATQVL